MALGKGQLVTRVTDQILFFFFPGLYRKTIWSYVSKCKRRVKEVGFGREEYELTLIIADSDCKSTGRRNREKIFLTAAEILLCAKKIYNPYAIILYPYSHTYWGAGQHNG